MAVVDMFSWASTNELFLTLVVFLACGTIVYLSRIAPGMTGAVDRLGAVQTSHERPTPRIGGLAIFAGLLISLSFAPLAISDLYQKLLIGTGLVFIVALAEDLGVNISARVRLIAVLIASSLVMLLLGVWFHRADVAGLDVLLGHWSFGIPITLLVTAGIANGFNLIDGVNGLAAFTGVIAALALAFISESASYGPMVPLTLMLAAVLIGFFVWNFPFGSIFLGDAGAYTIGFILSWFAIMIVVNAPTVSPWAVLLTMFWPVADTALAIWRRAGRRRSTMLPDKLHVHQLVMRALEIHVLGRRRRRLANPLSTVLIAPFIIGPAVAGVVFWNDTLSALLAFLACSMIFFTSYSVAFSIQTRLPRCKYVGHGIRKGVAILNRDINPAPGV
jgi:UDP-N-acetylmuramyl pentapeptide phosphotransferase/UDP-N-acetylglucosamine-1-phosphate transferase